LGNFEQDLVRYNDFKYTETPDFYNMEDPKPHAKNLIGRKRPRPIATDAQPQDEVTKRFKTSVGSQESMAIG